MMCQPEAVALVYSHELKCERDSFSVKQVKHRLSRCLLRPLLCVGGALVHPLDVKNSLSFPPVSRSKATRLDLFVWEKQLEVLKEGYSLPLERHLNVRHPKFQPYVAFVIGACGLKCIFKMIQFMNCFSYFVFCVFRNRLRITFFTTFLFCVGSNWPQLLQ